MTAAPAWHRFRSRTGQHVLVVAGSQILDIADTVTDDALAAELADYLDHGDTLALDTIPSVAPQGISLNVTSACNLGCSYCYADRGAFDGQQTGRLSMTSAQTAVDELLAHCDRRALATVGFLGGEPFLHPALIREVVAYATAQAQQLGQPLGFSVTTNGTRLQPEDHKLIRTHRFALTVSIDGGRATQDLLRRDLLNRSTFDDVVAAVTPLLTDPGRADVSARATVTTGNIDLTDRYDALTDIGFRRIGFAPVRAGFGAFTDADWLRWTAESIRLAERELARLLTSGDSGFTNFSTALHRLHGGASSPFPCGAGGGYASVSTDGRWYACHRAIGNPDYALAGRGTAVDATRQHAFLAERHVDRIAPCNTCWARYLCSGGCHQEAAARTDASCRAIRAWLDYCLDAYCTLSAARPEWFGDTDGL